MSKGWTFEKGAAGEEVESGVTIYSSTSCLSVVRAGGKQDSTNTTPGTGVTLDNYSDAVIQQDETRLKFDEAYDKYDLEKCTYNSIITSSNMVGFDNHIWCINFVKKTYKSCAKQYGEGTPECDTAYKEILSTDKEYNKRLDKSANAYFQAYTYEEKLKELEKSFDAEWGKYAKEQGIPIGTSQTSEVASEPPIVEQQKKMDKELDELSKQIAKTDLTAGAAEGLKAWLDAMEEYIDNMPQLKEVNTPLYEVEKKDSKWVYTGNSALPDPAYNKKIREFKQKQCKKLNKIVETATKKSETKLNDLAKKCSPIMPMVEAIKTIKGGLSISTIVDWGKAAINMFTSIYQMFYNTYKSIMELMEIIVIRFPQLINKIMKKMTELDCPIERPTISVKIPKVPTTKKNKTSGGVAGDDTTIA